jgi:hypothetical protein
MEDAVALEDVAAVAAADTEDRVVVAQAEPEEVAAQVDPVLEVDQVAVVAIKQNERDLCYILQLNTY